MSKSILDRVIDELVGKVAEITKTAGYQSDLGEDVSFNAPAQNMQKPNEHACIKVMEEVPNEDDGTIGARLNEIFILIYVVTRGNPFTLISDLKKALINERADPIAADTVYEGFGREDMSTTEVEIYQTRWTVSYYEAWLDPYQNI